VKFAKAKKFEELTLTYLLTSFIQSFEVGEEFRKEANQQRWIGNSLMKVEPPGEHMPMFTNAPRSLPAYTKRRSSANGRSGAAIWARWWSETLSAARCRTPTAFRVGLMQISGCQRLLL